MEEIIRQAEQLRQQIRHHEYLYFVKNSPEISDFEFDKLLLQLKKLESGHPEIITPDSPTQRIGETLTSFNAVKHRVKMLSIDNSYSAGDIMDWLARLEKLAGRSIFPVVAELKIDGVSGSFSYNQGSLTAAATRGNGVEGDLITGNAKTIRSLPLTINSHLDMDLRGEIYIQRSSLDQINQQRIEQNEEPFKNCRNLTSGTVKSLDPSVAAERKLQVMIYGIAQALELGFKSHSQALLFLQEQGFKLNHRWQVCKNSDEIMAFIKQIEEERRAFDFDIDGVVLKVDDLALQDELQTTSKAPRWAIAYKYPQERAMTKLLQVEWQTGRSQLTPVAHLEPVQLGGTTVSRASLHNIDQIREKDIRVGDTVIVEKAGYIIPYIVAPVTEKRNGSETPVAAPANCPVCGAALITIAEEPGETSTQIRCENLLCRGVIARRIIHFITQMEIENFGPQLVERLLENSIIKTVEDITRLSKDTLAALDRMGEKSAAKIVKNIADAADKPLGRLISALGISNVGTVISESIADKYEQSLSAFLAASDSELISIFGIEKKVAGNIVEFLAAAENKELLNTLQQWWKGPSAEMLAKMKTADTLSGKAFVVTGEAAVPRRLIENCIKRYGGQIKSSVSPKTDFLLIGSGESADFTSSKKTKALQLSIPVIDEYKLCEILGITIEKLKDSGNDK